MSYIRQKKSPAKLQAEYDKAELERAEAIRLARLSRICEAGNDGWKRRPVFDELRQNDK